jgi:hypothetical protein
MFTQYQVVYHLTLYHIHKVTINVVYHAVLVHSTYLYNSRCMPSYIHRRQLTPAQTRETLPEVRARLIDELRRRTEEKINHWDQLGDWCRQRLGRFISVNWRSDRRNSSSSVVGETNAEAAGISIENNISSSSSTTVNTGSVSLSVEDSVGGSSSITSTISTDSNVGHLKVSVSISVVEQPD